MNKNGRKKRSTRKKEVIALTDVKHRKGHKDRNPNCVSYYHTVCICRQGRWVQSDKVASEKEKKKGYIRLSLGFLPLKEVGGYL